MTDQTVFGRLLSPTINACRPAKSKRRRGSRARDPAADQSKPLDSGSFSSQLRKRRDALLHELDLQSQLSMAKMRRRRNLMTADKYPTNALEMAELRRNTYLAAELGLSGKYPPVKLRSHSSRMQEVLVATCSSSKPYNESRLLTAQGGGCNSTVTESVQPTQAQAKVGSSQTLTRQLHNKSESCEPKTTPEISKPDVHDLYGIVAQRNETSMLDSLASGLKGTSAVGTKRTSTDKVSTTKGGSVMRIKSMSEKRHNTSHQSSYDARLASYKDFIQLVLHCNAVYFDWVFPTVLERERRVEVFVGQGNNSALIRKVLKKRWWLTPTQAITSNTQFVWTQIKHKGFVLFQRTRSAYHSKDKFEGTAEEGSWGPLGKIMHRAELPRQKQSVLPLSYREVVKRKEPARLLNYVQRVHNHLQYSGFIGNKKSLLNCLTTYYRYHKTPLNRYSIPLTFHVAETGGQKEFANFREVFLERACNQPTIRKSNIWIIKPGENSNRGRGITVASNLSDISARVKEGRHSHVIQEYIGELLLYHKRKFDIRAYCLVTQVCGVLRVYWYEEGYIRTSSELFRTDCLAEPLIHLTNDAVQKHGPNYGRYEPANKVSFEEFQRYLIDSGCPEQLSLGHIVAEMKRIVTEVIRSSYCLLDPHCRQNNFQLFGVDFLVDSAMRLWLLEFNTNPCLELCSPVLSRLLPRMLDNVMTLTVDPLLPMPPNKNRQYFPDTNLANNRFQLIFDSTFDRDEAYQQFVLRHVKNASEPELDEEA